MNISNLKEELIAQRKSKFKGNIYHYSQVNFAYNSNKIEGSKLTEDETEEIFETDSFVPNKIGLINIINTSSPENVEKELDGLLAEYYSLKNITVEDIIDFHYRFERIHPFGNGNGRVGRMIMFKE